MTVAPAPTYKTTELEIASFLKARGHRLVAAKMDGRFVAFEFEPAAASDVAAYFSGAETSARGLFEAHRGLRAMIQQVREHSAQQTRIGSERTSDEHLAYPPR
jgi:hypothetical protein